MKDEGLRIREIIKIYGNISYQSGIWSTDAAA